MLHRIIFRILALIQFLKLLDQFLDQQQVDFVIQGNHNFLVILKGNSLMVEILQLRICYQLKCKR